VRKLGAPWFEEVSLGRTGRASSGTEDRVPDLRPCQFGSLRERLGVYRLGQGRGRTCTSLRRWAREMNRMTRFQPVAPEEEASEGRHCTPQYGALP
jgi:hypothetical protein